MNVTTSIVVLCIFFFIFQALLGPDFTSVGVLSSSLLLAEPWRIFTSMFLHGDLGHLFFNMFALFIFGNALEKRVGGPLFLLIYLVSGVVGAAGFMLFSAPYESALGASGAIFGIIGALVIVAPKMVVYLFGGIPMPMYVVGILYALIELFALSGSGDGIAHSAHLLGFFGGFGVVSICKQREEELYSLTVNKAIAVSVIFGLLVALFFGYINAV